MNPVGYRQTWAEVSLDAIAHNAGLFRKRMSEDCLLMAVVKADGYGHGALEAARAAVAAGAGYLGVAFVDEALRLREAGVEMPILVLGYTPGHAIEAAVRHRIAFAVSSRDTWEQAAAVSEKLGGQARIHLKVDTGMSRLGFAPDEVLPLYRICANAHVMIEGIFTHFADADNPDPTFTRRQYGEFVALTERLAASGIRIPLRHCCNSAAAMKFPEMHMDMVRIGIAMYGLTPLEGEPLSAYPLREAMQFKTRISFLKTVEAGRPVSYGLTYRTPKESRIATLPVGYADGLSRRLSNNGFVLICGQRVPIVGRICMDQAMIDATSVPDAYVGEEVTLFGESEGRRLSIHEIACRMGTIPYEVVCLIGKRVPRVYVGQES